MQKENVGESKGEERKSGREKGREPLTQGFLRRALGRWLAERRPAVGAVRGRYGDKNKEQKVKE